MSSRSESNQKNPYDYDYLDKSPMFKLSLSSKELFHSNFLEYLSTVESENHIAFKSLVQKMAGIENYSWPEHWMVLREYHNFDLCIVECNPEEEKGESLDEEDPQGKSSTNEDTGRKQEEEISEYRILFVIENKVKSIPYEEQLKRYTREAEEQNWRYFAKKAKEELNNSKKVLKGESWYKQNDSGWYKWNENGSCWNHMETKPEEALEQYGKTNFYKSYIKDIMEDQPIHFILLSLAEDFPNKPKDFPKWTFKDIKLFGKNECLIESWNIVLYSQYAEYLNVFEGKEISDLNKLVIKDYICFIKSLIFITKKWSQDYKYQNDPETNSNKFLYFSWDDEKKPKKRIFEPEFSHARKYRIHDLYQKTKYSYLCGILYDKINNHIEKKGLESLVTVFPSNQGEIFKTGQENARKECKYICVNQTYLHGEPLLEINIHPDFNLEIGYEYCYAIQVQGGVYEHGFEVKKWEKNKEESITAAEVWKAGIPFPNSEEWMRTPTLEDSDTSWGKECECFHSDILPKKKDPGYNKYDMKKSTYLYQSRRINSNATIGVILNQMIKDTEQVVEWLWGKQFNAMVSLSSSK